MLDKDTRDKLAEAARLGMVRDLFGLSFVVAPPLGRFLSKTDFAQFVVALGGEYKWDDHSRVDVGVIGSHTTRVVPTHADRQRLSFAARVMQEEEFCHWILRLGPDA